MTQTLLREIPTLEPDDAFVARLAELAAASTPARAIVVPVAFTSPAVRAAAVAAAVAAITAGAAAAATQLSHTHPEPTPPITSVGTPSPGDDDSDDTGRTHDARDDATPAGTATQPAATADRRPDGRPARGRHRAGSRPGSQPRRVVRHRRRQPPQRARWTE